jgi:glycyl-tRNA synthetase beta chain
MNTKSLLVELFVEELPPKALKGLGEVFANQLLEGLKSRGLAGEHSALTPFASPRRLGAHISGVRAQADDQEVVRKLMPTAVGLANGKPTDALRKSLAKLGRAHLADLWPNAVDGPDKVYVQIEGKAEVLYLRSLAKGCSLQAGLQFALDEAIAALPIAKVMSYQLADGWETVRFVRPAHGLVALHGADVVPISAFGLNAGRETQGHRFEAPMTPVVLQDADHYARQMEEQGAVLASFAHRHSEIARQLQHAAAAQGLTPIDDAALLDEVTALVERPNVLVCSFDPAFLEVPAECLILTMKANQKYFPLLDAQGRLTNKFLVVANIRPADASAVIGGNERVVRPRLADARFFFDQDRKKSLESRVPGLAKVVYHAKLGTMGERVERVCAIARAIGQLLGGEALAVAAERAALLAKADLLTDMVGEFPELQGIMGSYYARHDGLADEIALAIEDHYKPRFAGDALPRQNTGVAVALADKLETLAGLFGIGQVPSGDKDPFALRRHALGLIRMLIERGLPLAVPQLVDLAFGAFPVTHGRAQADVTTFLYDRLVGYLREQGYSAHEVEAVIALRPPSWAEIPQRLAAVRAFASLPEAQPLAAANKRVGNILKKSDGGAPAALDAALLADAAERALYDSLASIGPRSAQAFDAGDYTGSLRTLAALKAPVDRFFDEVMVNVDDPLLRANRLALLGQLHTAMNRVADLSKLAS